LKVIDGDARLSREPARRSRQVENGTRAEVGRPPSAAPLRKEKTMSTRTEALAPWHWVTTTTHFRPRKVVARQELWAAGIYLAVWSVLWLAVIVSVLLPLAGIVG
jgi:hypothetical protein